MKKIIALISLTFFVNMLLAEDITYTDFTTMQDNINSVGLIVVKQQELVSDLSNDIGLMAEEIGKMADRIVSTEEILSQTLTTLTSSQNNAVVLTSPSDGDKLSDAPTISMIPSSATYLIFASAEPTFNTGATLSLYISNNSTLESKWSQVSEFCGSTACYLSIKRIDGTNNTISTISNSVKVSF